MATQRDDRLSRRRWLGLSAAGVLGGSLSGWFANVARLTAAYQAYYEHMPVRATAIPNGPHIRMYRTLRFGQLATLNVLDTRQYRSDQAAGQEGAKDPAHTMPGAAQRLHLLHN